MQGFKRAQAEYERKMTAPFDCDEDEGLTLEEWKEIEADAEIEERLLREDE